MFFGGRTLVNVDDWQRSVRGLQKSRRLGDGSKCANGRNVKDQSHSQYFLMKILLKATSDGALESTICLYIPVI